MSEPDSTQSVELTHTNDKASRRPTKAVNKEQLEKRRLAELEMRLAGVQYRQIAEHFGVDVHTAWDDIQWAMQPTRNTLDEVGEKARRLDLWRLDRLLRALWPRAVGARATSPDDFAVDRVLKILDRRARLLGLDAPSQHEMVGDTEIVLQVVGTDVRRVDTSATGEKAALVAGTEETGASEEVVADGPDTEGDET